MNHFYNSSSSHQSVFMIFVFFAMILCLCNCFGLLYRKKSNHLRLLNTGIFVVLFMLESVFGQAFRKTRLNEAYDEILKLPMWSLWCVAVASSILLAWETAILIRGNKKELHRDSVKQAMDTLHNAICYFTSDGAVKLCNLQMYRLFHSLAQSDLQSLEDLHQALDGCDRQSGIIRLSDELQTYLFPDGKAWRYSETEVRASDGNSFIEAIFTDVTELYEDSLKLKEQTKHLEQISRDLKLLSYNVQTVAKEQEILSAKPRFMTRWAQECLLYVGFCKAERLQKLPMLWSFFKKPSM